MRIRRHIASAALIGAAVGMFAFIAPAAAVPTASTDTITVDSDLCYHYKQTAEKYFALAKQHYRNGDTAKGKAYQSAGQRALKAYYACRS